MFSKKTRSPLLIVSKVSFLKSRMIEVILLRSSFLKSRFTTPHCVLRRFSEIGCLDSQIPRNQFFLNYWEITYHLCRRPNTELHLLLGKSNAFTFSKRHQSFDYVQKLRLGKSSHRIYIQKDVLTYLASKSYVRTIPKFIFRPNSNLIRSRCHSSSFSETSPLDLQIVANLGLWQVCLLITDFK